VSRISTHQFAPHLGIEPPPESGKVGLGLHSPLVRREQVYYQRGAVGPNAWRLSHPEKVPEDETLSKGACRRHNESWCDARSAIERSPERVPAEASNLSFAQEVKQGPSPRLSDRRSSEVPSTIHKYLQSIGLGRPANSTRAWNCSSESPSTNRSMPISSVLLQRRSDAASVSGNVSRDS
jgi:hypothetical protein